MELKSDQTNELYVFAKELADHKMTYDEIENKLSQKTEDPIIIQEIISLLKKEKCLRRRKNGLTKIGIGTSLMFGGFLITCINFHSDKSFETIMFTTSTIGLILIFWGFYDILG